MLCDIVLQQILNSVDGYFSLGLSPLARRITSFQFSRKDLLCCHAGLVKGDPPVWPDRELAQACASTTSAVKNDEYFATLGRDLHAEAGETDIPVHHICFASRQRVDGALGQFETRHRRKLLSRATFPSNR